VSDIFNRFKAVHIVRPKWLNDNEIHNFLGIIPHMGGIALPEVAGKCNISFGYQPNVEIAKELHSDDPKVVAKYLKDLKVFELEDYDDFAQQWVNQKWNTTGQVHCNFYHSSKMSIIIMGDAAHATSPALGMGMNTALADAGVLDDLMNLHGDDLDKVLPAFSKERVKEGNALASVSLNQSSMDPNLARKMYWRGVVRRWFHSKCPGCVKPDPITNFKMGGAVLLSDVYADLVEIGWMGMNRESNDAIRREYFERNVGMLR